MSRRFGFRVDNGASALYIDTCVIGSPGSHTKEIGNGTGKQELTYHGRNAEIRMFLRRRGQDEDRPREWPVAQYRALRKMQPHRTASSRF
jgi:hypothetical protein